MDKTASLESKRETLKARVEAMLPSQVKGNESKCRACTVMLAALETGPHIERIAELTGYEKAWVEEIAARMKASGLWTETGTDYGSWSRRGSCRTKQESLDFVMDMMVATGTALRTRSKRRGHYVYQSLVWEGMRPV